MGTRTKTCLVGLAAGIAMACGSSSSAPAVSQPGFFITISGMSFSPLDLHAPAGAIVTVVNEDGIDHSVTSEASANAFTPGSVGGVAFDTGAFTGSRSFTLPANAPNGTAIPYYCTVHKAIMATPNGTLTVDSSAQPTQPPGGGGGGGGGY